jgi:hypothetical protein
MVLLPVVNFGIEPERDASARPIIELHRADDFLADWESDCAEKRRPPRTKIGGRDRIAEGAVKRLIEIGPPENRCLADVESDVLEDDSDRSDKPDTLGVEVKIRLRRIVCREAAVLDRVFLVRVARSQFSRQEVRVSAGAHSLGVDRFRV